MKFLKSLLILLVIISMLVSCNIFPQQEIITTTTNGTSTTTSITTSKNTTTQSTTTTNSITTIQPNIDFDPDADEGPESDPYINMSEAEFYANYTPATTYWDSFYRSMHYFMSGSIEEQDQAPTIDDNRPMEDGKYIRNTSALYSTDGNTYYIIDSEGNIVNKIFKGGAYVTLEEVAAYVLAFGDVPANYTSSKKTKPYNSPWGEYLRLNHSAFSGDTSRYPYEPVLPDISGCGGDLRYYEIDIGTTGTDCDDAYAVKTYNDGKSITRGAARIVYGKYDLDKDGVYERGEHHVFYTYNHYNDFQEYLNYYGGWGEMFGNITGGGELSSKKKYNPTSYVEVIREVLPAVESKEPKTVIYYYYYDPKQYCLNVA
jgi:hypothetical protein